MAPKLQIRRGLKKDLPALAAGEFGLCLDTNEVYVGTPNGNLPVVLPDGTGDMLKSVYDTDGDGVVDKAESVPWAGVTGKPASLPANGGNADTVDGKHASEFATAAQGAKADAAVPSTRKINGKALSSDISLSAADVGALASAGKAQDTAAVGGLTAYVAEGQDPYWYLGYTGVGNKDGTIPIYWARGARTATVAERTGVVGQRYSIVQSAGPGSPIYCACTFVPPSGTNVSNCFVAAVINRTFSYQYRIEDVSWETGNVEIIFSGRRGDGSGDVVAVFQRFA